MTEPALQLGALRRVARDLGWVLAVHGSAQRDIDLVAVPWTLDACEAFSLMRALAEKVNELGSGPVGNSELLLSGGYSWKPHGRVSWSLHPWGHKNRCLDIAIVDPREAISRGYRSDFYYERQLEKRPDR